MEATRPSSFATADPTAATPSMPGISPARLAAFGASLSGTLVVPGDADFDQARQVHNSRFDRVPTIVVQAADAADVSRTVLLAAQTGLELAVRSGGHSLAGYGTSEGGIVLDLSPMKGLLIDPDRRLAWAQPGLTAGEVSVAAAELTGLRPGTPVAAGGGDTQLGLLGAGAQRDEYTVVAGTFWQNTVLLAEPLIDPQIRLRTLCHVMPGEWMLEGIGFYCGMSMRWFRDAFCDAEVALARARGVDPYVVMEEIAAAVPAGSGGVIAILSNLMNARRWAHASPSFLQFDLADPAASGRGACVRAIEEAAAYVARGHRDIITELTGLTFGEVIFTGGAGRGRLWPQIMADVLGVPVHIPAVTESSALGAAICAGAGAGVYSDLLELRPGLRRRTATFEPDQAATAAYDEQYAAWREIYRRMLEITDDGLLNPLWRAAGA